MRVHFIVILNPSIRLSQDSCCIRPIAHVHLVRFEGLHERFGHSVRVRTSRWRKAWDQPRRFGKRGPLGRVAAGVFTQYWAQPADDPQSYPAFLHGVLQCRSTAWGHKIQNADTSPRFNCRCSRRTTKLIILVYLMKGTCLEL